ncbi:unnamed protein product, partial [marine sediment metagenome]
IILSQYVCCKQAAADPALVKDTVALRSGDEEILIRPYMKELELQGKKYIIFRDEEKEGALSLLDEESNTSIQLISSGGKRRSLRINKKVYDVSIISGKNIPSAKYERLDKLVEEITARGEKIVIFTNYRDVVKRLKGRFEKYGVCTLLGGGPVAKRDDAIEEFQTSKDKKILIATLKTGGEAINLTAANNVIFMDKPWTPQEVWQAVDRLHRFGQDKPVNIYSLVAQNTVDERVEIVLRDAETVFYQTIEGYPTPRHREKIVKDLIRVHKGVKDLHSYFARKRRRERKKAEKAKLKTFVESKDAENGFILKILDINTVTGRLMDVEGNFVKFENIREILGRAPPLDDSSKAFLKEFLTHRLDFEHSTGIQLKASILWPIFS